MNIPSKEEVIEIIEKGIKKSETFIDKGLRKPIPMSDLYAIHTYVKWSLDYNDNSDKVKGRK